MDSHLAIHDFIEANNIDRDEFGNCTFTAIIDYQSPAISDKATTEVKIIRNGYNDGEINLSEGGPLTVENYHLDFTIDYQVYSYNSNSKELEVTGKSPKMGGAYKVSIYPV
ncbi:hypothetical protein [Pseudoalteromonas piscicida]|uniref:hypothetical protein n=1 Tax=Pseudoalteromonas piscicida TaxID=43662 RepID=UPI003C7EAD61